jgi:hypothetical protein
LRLAVAAPMLPNGFELRSWSVCFISVKRFADAPAPNFESGPRGDIFPIRACSSVTRFRAGINYEDEHRSSKFLHIQLLCQLKSGYLAACAAQSFPMPGSSVPLVTAAANAAVVDSIRPYMHTAWHYVTTGEWEAASAPKTPAYIQPDLGAFSRQTLPSGLYSKRTRGPVYHNGRLGVVFQSVL